MKRLILGMVVLLTGVVPFVSADVVIDFESLAHDDPASPLYLSQYNEDGFGLRSQSAISTTFGVWGTTNPQFAGSTGMFNNQGEWTTLSRGNGKAFDLLSVDLSHMFDTTMGNSRMIVTFQGTRSDSSSVTRLIDVPRHFGFRTYSFTGLNDLVSVRWDQSAFGSVPHQFDDILLLTGPSNASFDGSSDLDSLAIDFGTLTQGGPAPTVSFDIWNYTSPGSADLDLDGIVGTGDTSVLTTNLHAFSGLAPSSHNSFLAVMDTSTEGSFGASYTLTFSDASSDPQASMVLELTGLVVPEPSTFVLLGMGAVGLLAHAWRRRRRR